MVDRHAERRGVSVIRRSRTLVSSWETARGPLSRAALVMTVAAAAAPVQLSEVARNLVGKASSSCVAYHLLFLYGFSIRIGRCVSRAALSMQPLV